MQIIHESRAINGHDYNRETADQRLVQRLIYVFSGYRAWSIEIDLPAYIADKLRSDDWDQVREQLNVYARKKSREAAMVGATPGMIRALLTTAAKKAIYDRFAAAQIRAGNDAWAVPMTIHGDQYLRVRNV